MAVSLVDSAELGERRFAQLDVQGTGTVLTPEAHMSGSLQALAITVGWTTDGVTPASSGENVVAQLDGQAYRHQGLLVVLGTPARNDPDATRIRIEPKGWRSKLITSGPSEPEGQFTLHRVQLPESQIVTNETYEEPWAAALDAVHDSSSSGTAITLLGPSVEEFAGYLQRDPGDVFSNAVGNLINQALQAFPNPQPLP